MNHVKRISQIALFSSCTPDQLRNISNAAQVKHYLPNEIITKEGTPAHSLYIILEGSAQAYTEDKSGQQIILARLETDSHFGEQAYLNNFIRTSFVRAITEITLLEIDYKTIDPIFKRSGLVRKFLQKISLGRSIANLQSQLKNIDAYVKKEIFTKSERTEMRHYHPGDIIFKRGQPSHHVYFVSTGAVSLSFSEEIADLDTVTITKNQMIGELGVLHGKPRAATARALDKCSVIVIDKADFLNASKNTMSLRSLTLAYSQLYKLPRENAKIEQYIGKYEGQETIYIKYKIKSKQILTAITVEKPIFSTKIIGSSPDTVLKYTQGTHIERKLSLRNGRIVGIISIGDWDELHNVYGMILTEDILPEQIEEQFKTTGRIFPESVLV